MENDNISNETLIVLREIRNWLRAGFHGQVRDLLSSVLNNDKKKRIYQMADGSTTIREVCKSCSVSTKSVLDLWNEATKKGLMEALPGGKRVRLFDLADFGLLEQSNVEVGNKNTAEEGENESENENQS